MTMELSILTLRSVSQSCNFTKGDLYLNNKNECNP